jgi:hypothetical protein
LDSDQWSGCCRLSCFRGAGVRSDPRAAGTGLAGDRCRSGHPRHPPHHLLLGVSVAASAATAMVSVTAGSAFSACPDHRRTAGHGTDLTGQAERLRRGRFAGRWNTHDGDRIGQGSGQGAVGVRAPSGCRRQTTATVARRRRHEVVRAERSRQAKDAVAVPCGRRPEV